MHSLQYDGQGEGNFSNPSFPTILRAGLQWKVRYAKGGTYVFFSSQRASQRAYIAIFRIFQGRSTRISRGSEVEEEGTRTSIDYTVGSFIITIFCLIG